MNCNVTFVVRLSTKHLETFLTSVLLYAIFVRLHVIVVIVIVVVVIVVVVIVVVVVVVVVTFHVSHKFLSCRKPVARSRL